MVTWIGDAVKGLLFVFVGRTYQMVLTIYEADRMEVYPTRNEVLICTNNTRHEEVR